MKLLRIGDVGSEKPALIDNENNYREQHNWPRWDQNYANLRKFSGLLFFFIVSNDHELP